MHKKSIGEHVLHTALAGVFTAGIIASAAVAQSAPMPVGYWVSKTSNATLFVTAARECKFQGSVVLVGRCTWRPSSRGGILTIYYWQVGHENPVYENITWVNKSTITVWGEYFYRRA